MCCFAQDILNVFDTFIFGRLSGKGTQFLVYEMKYESETANAMILPIPIQLPSAESSVKFIDLSKYEHFFADLDSAFPELRKRSWGLPSNSIDAAAGGLLEIHEVGNFQASFVPTVDDFDRLDPKFVIPKETWNQIPSYSDYGFVVFQLKSLSGKPHPMAFEFKTRTDQVFFPTVHIHDGMVHELEDFDHVLYLQHAGFDNVAGSYKGPKKSDPTTGLIRSRDVARNYCNIDKSKSVIEPDLLIHKTSMRGRLPNRDTLFSANVKPFSTGFSPQRLTRYWPVLIPVAVTAWFFNRRSQLNSSQPNPNATSNDTPDLEESS